MSKIERTDCIKVELSPKNPFRLTFNDGERNRSLSVEEPKNFGEGTTLAAQDLLRTVMLAHLISPYFPKVIETNFDLVHEVFLDELYKYYGFSAPRIVKSNDQIQPRDVSESVGSKIPVKYANAHSGGLDSLYRLARLGSKGERVLAVHLRNLNSKSMSYEATASRKQAEVMGQPFFELRLLNSSGNTNSYTTMRTRDLFLGLAAAVVSKPFGAEKVYVEGDMYQDKSGPFSSYEGAWQFLNRLIREVDLGLKVDWIDPGDIETVGEIIKLESELGIDILPLVQNCFSAPFQIPTSRRKWERDTPYLAKKSPEHWCGSCIKCRRVTLGRIYYGDPKLGAIPRKEIGFFINDTHDWMKKYPHNKNLVTESFLSHLGRLGLK